MLKIFEKVRNLLNSRALPFLVSIIPPSVFLLYLYQRNADYLSIWHTLIAIAVFTLGAVFLYLIVSKLVKSSIASMLICNVLWVLFFLIKVPLQFYPLIIRKYLAIYLSIMIVITAIILTLIIRYKKIIEKQLMLNILSAFWLVIFILNVVPTFFSAINNHYKYTGNEKNYKTEFYVDNNLLSPNIYWLLMDGMLGFKAMEYLFNDTQLEFTTQLIERGFIINRDAQFEALHATSFGIPVLMCPFFYDISFVTELRNFNLNDYEQKIKISKNINFIKSNKLARIKNELITAFNQKSVYQTSVIATGSTYLPPITNNYYKGNRKIISDVETMNDIENIEFGLKLLFGATPLSKFSFLSSPLTGYINTKTKSTTISKISIDFSKSFFGESYRGNDKWYFNAITDIMNYSGPKLVIIHDLKTHSPYIYDEHGNLIKRNYEDLINAYSYPSQHYFASAIVISYIDMILNEDPEAIIVLQSDHGLSNDVTRQLLISKYGKIDEDVRMMQNQTISAVRIPEKWGGLEQPIEPPNITRLLVNRYVGENYRLLSPEDIIK